MTDLLTVQKMHIFRPVFTLPPCAPHPGHRSTPVTLDNWIHIALVGCHIPASASKHTKKGTTGPPFRQLRMQQQLSTPQPPRPLRQLHLQHRPSQPRCCNYARNGGYIHQSYRVRYGNRNRSTSKRSPAVSTSPRASGCAPWPRPWHRRRRKRSGARSPRPRGRSPRPAW